MVATRNMTAEDTMEAIKMLQQQMEDMRRQHEEELSAVREECTIRIAQVKAARSKGKEKMIDDRGAEREESQAQTLREGPAEQVAPWTEPGS